VAGNASSGEVAPITFWLLVTHVTHLQPLQHHSEEWRIGKGPSYHTRRHHCWYRLHLLVIPVNKTRTNNSVLISWQHVPRSCGRSSCLLASHKSGFATSEHSTHIRETSTGLKTFPWQDVCPEFFQPEVSKEPSISGYKRLHRFGHAIESRIKKWAPILHNPPKWGTWSLCQTPEA
jgi:hypothetical protein